MEFSSEWPSTISLPALNSFLVFFCVLRFWPKCFVENQNVTIWSVMAAGNELCPVALLNFYLIL